MASTELLSRAQLGMRPPDGPYSPLAAEGLTGHYAGGALWGNPDPARWDHGRCPSIWRAWQDHHMAPGGLGVPDGAIDIGYNSGCCPHGSRLEGRGPGHRSAANGTNEGNTRSAAVVYLAGAGEPLTDAAKWAFLDEEARYGLKLRWLHSDWYATACPGPLGSWIRAGCPAPATPPPLSPPVPVVPPLLAVTREWFLEDLMATIVITEYPVSELRDGVGYWDLDGAPNRPLVKAGRLISVEVNGADAPHDPKVFPHSAEPLKFGAFTRIRLDGFEKGAKPTLIVASIRD